ncbi:MAG: hypothetical protein DME18_16980, partial [Verrucomicrobia bacterium]
MKNVFQGWLRLICLVAIFQCGPALRVRAADSLVWREDQNQVEADIESWPLSKVLESISAATDWQIYVEPDTEYTVTTRFHNLLLPQTNGPARLFIYRESVYNATQLIQVAKRPKPETPDGKPIPNELIVRLKPGAKESIDALAKRLGAKVVGRLDGFNAYRLQFDDAAAAQAARSELENNTDVESVENNFSVAAPGQLQPLAMSSPSSPSFKLAPPGSSDKLIVALVDTPVQSTRAPWADYLVEAVSLAGEANPDPNQVTHGTAMMDTLWDALGKALDDPASASLGFLSLDVYGNKSTTTMFDVARAIVEAVNKGARIVNLSLGGYGDSPLLDNVLAQARAQGVLLVAAAGNDGGTALTIPASKPEVLAVTSGKPDGTIASYANHGDFVDLIAPGASVILYNHQAYLVTGTSTAAANASGAAAALSINNHQSPIEASAQIPKLRGFAPPKR